MDQVSILCECLFVLFDCTWFWDVFEMIVGPDGSADLFIAHASTFDLSSQSIIEYGYIRRMQSCYTYVYIPLFNFIYIFMCGALPPTLCGGCRAYVRR